MPNQVATGAGKAFAYGTGAGGSMRMANQEAMGADKAFAHGTSAGGRSHLAKLRDSAPWRPAPERIRSKNERLSAQSFTRGATRWCATL